MECGEEWLEGLFVVFVIWGQTEAGLGWFLLRRSVRAEFFWKSLLVASSPLEVRCCLHWSFFRWLVFGFLRWFGSWCWDLVWCWCWSLVWYWWCGFCGWSRLFDDFAFWHGVGSFVVLMLLVLELLVFLVVFFMWKQVPLGSPFSFCESPLSKPLHLVFGLELAFLSLPPCWVD